MNRAPTKFTRASCLTPHAYPVITAVALLPLLSVTVTVVVPAMLIEQGLQPAAIIGALRSLRTIETLPSRRIFQAIFTIEDAGGRLGFDEINGRLEEADQNLLAQAVLNEDGEVVRDEVIASVVSMQRSEQQNLRGDLKSRIGEAERAGHFDEAIRLTMELQGLERAERGRRQ